MTRVRHEWKKLILIPTRVKTYFHNPIFTIWQLKDYKERNNFILRTTFWKCLTTVPKYIWNDAPQKLNFIMAKDISKSYTLDCSCSIVTHSSAASFSIKTILRENTNILFGKNYCKLSKMNARFSKNI